MSKSQLQTNNSKLSALITELQGTRENLGVAERGDVLVGVTFSSYNEGLVETGTMPNNGAISKTINALTETSVTVPSGYTSGGTVSLTNDLANEVEDQSELLDMALAALEGKAAGGGGNIETCTLRLIVPYGQPLYNATAFYTQVNNGVINSFGSYEQELYELEDVTINNVLCNSIVVIYGSVNEGSSIDAIVDGASFVANSMSADMVAFKIEAPNGGTATIEITQ